jgi:hypothetical protein
MNYENLKTEIKIHSSKGVAHNISMGITISVWEKSGLPSVRLLKCSSHQCSTYIIDVKYEPETYKVHNPCHRSYQINAKVNAAPKFKMQHKLQESKETSILTTADLATTR